MTLCRPPFACTSGPKDAKVVIVGEAFGQQEAMVKRPFIGASGQELTRMLKQADLDRFSCLLTNVFAFQPETNNLDTLCTSRSSLPKDYSHAMLSQGKYIKKDFLPELDRLRDELSLHPRNLIILLGNTACWAVLGHSRIGAIRGTVSHSTMPPGLKCLPTYHPAAVLRNWSNRPVVIADLMKAKRESEFPEIQRPRREIIIDPGLEDIEAWFHEHKDTPFLSVDIETGNGLIKCVGFASSPSNAIVIPFVDFRQPSGSYWSSHHEERQAWTWVERFLLLPSTKVMQNGAYDIQYLLRQGLRMRNCLADTMLASHALFPEMPKSLGFLGSIFSSESAWKTMRRQAEQVKKDE